MNWVGEGGGATGSPRRAKMLVATAKKQKRGKKRRKGQIFQYLLVSPSPTLWSAKGGGLGWRRRKKKTLANLARGTGKICLQIRLIVRRRLQSQKIRVELQVCGQNYICAGLAWLARLAK